jgi:hypothetical protein
VIRVKASGVGQASGVLLWMLEIPEDDREGVGGAERDSRSTWILLLSSESVQ